MLWVRIPPELLTYVLVEQRSARLPVTQEDHRCAAVPGFKSHRGRSNSKARYANRQSGEAQTFVIVCGFDSHPCYLANMRRLGIGKPQWP